MPAGPAVTYKVTGVTPDTQFTATNTIISGKRVAFSTSTGYAGSVFVPDGVFADASAIKSLIEDQVRLVAMAQQINGSVPGQ